MKPAASTYTEGKGKGSAPAAARPATTAPRRGALAPYGRGAALRRIALAALAVVVAAALVAAALAAMRASALEQGAQSAREAVLNAAMQCCAVEGSYPSTIEHLEEHYGLSVNHDDYIIMYEAFASNVMPSVTVVPR